MNILSNPFIWLAFAAIVVVIAIVALGRRSSSKEPEVELRLLEAELAEVKNHLNSSNILEGSRRQLQLLAQQRKLEQRISHLREMLVVKLQEKRRHLEDDIAIARHERRDPGLLLAEKSVLETRLADLTGRHSHV